MAATYYPDTTPVLWGDMTVGLVVNMDEVLTLLDPEDVPLTMGIQAESDAGRTPIIPTGPRLDRREFNWLDDNHLLPYGTLQAAITTTTITVVTVATGTQARYQTGQTLRVMDGSSDEVMLITDYGTTADTLLVTRGIVGTAATAATGDTLYVTGDLAGEGAKPPNARTVDRTINTNYSQIFGPTQVSMSRTEQSINKYGVSSEWNHQLMKRIRELQIEKEINLLYGKKVYVTASNWRQSGGIDEFIATNVDTSSTQLTITSITAQQKASFAYGRVPRIIVCNQLATSDLNAIEDTNRVRQTVTETLRGRMPALVVSTEYGLTEIVRNRYVRSNNAYGIIPEAIIDRPFDPLTATVLAKIGDFDSLMLVSENGWEVKGEERMFKFTALSYS